MDKLAVSLLQSLPIGVVVIKVCNEDLSLARLESANEAADNALSGHVMPNIGRLLVNIPNCPDILVKGVKTAFESKKTIFFDDVLYESNNVKGWFNLRIYRIDSTEFVVVTVENITHLKKFQNQKETLEGRYRAFIKATPDMLHLINSDGVILDTHKGTVPAYVKSYTGRNIADLFPPWFTEKAMSYIQKTIETGEIQTWEYVMPFSNTPNLIFECQFSKSGPKEVLAIIRDITELRQEHKRLEAKVLERTRQLEASNHALQSFVYAASHDLREPLTKITAFGNRLTDSRLGLNDKGQEYLSVILNSSDRLLQLIDDLLSFSRLGDKDQNPLQMVDVNKVLEEVLDDLAIPIEEHKAEIHVQKNLPQIVGHHTRIKQVFQNLISNSLKFQKVNEIPIIIIDGDQEKDKVLFRIKDNGIGFDPKFKDKIFQVFTRLYSRSEYPGTGIGLALCRRILSHYGGAITGHSEPFKGATFTLEFPVELLNDATAFGDFCGR